jgi:hypothetical protein
MGWGSNYRNSGIRHIDSYEQALKQFETTKPIRGREVECRPLGHRDRPHFSIQKAEDGSIVCCDYNPKHKTVVFKPDGEVVVVPTWVSTSTAAFIEEVLGIRAKVFDHCVVISLSGTYYRLPKAGLTIKRNDNGAYEALDAAPRIVHRIKRRESNIVRAKYSEFRDYLTGFIRLRGEDNRIEEDEYKEVFGVTVQTYNYGGGDYTYERIATPDTDMSEPENVTAMIGWMTSDEAMDKYKCALALIKNSSGYYRIKESSVLTLLDRFILAHHKDTVFEEVLLEAGDIRKDRYSWAFK